MYMLAPVEKHREMENAILSIGESKQAEVVALKVDTTINATKRTYRKFKCFIFESGQNRIVLAMDGRNNSKMFCYIVDKELLELTEPKFGCRNTNFLNSWAENANGVFRIILEFPHKIRQAKYRQLVDNGENELEALSKVTKQISYSFRHEDLLEI